MLKPDIERAIQDVFDLQTHFCSAAGYETKVGDTALALLRAELARPEPKPTAYFARVPRDTVMDGSNMEYVQVPKGHDNGTPLFTKDQL